MRISFGKNPRSTNCVRAIQVQRQHGIGCKQEGSNGDGGRGEGGLDIGQPLHWRGLHPPTCLGGLSPRINTIWARNYTILDQDYCHSMLSHSPQRQMYSNTWHSSSSSRLLIQGYHHHHQVSKSKLAVVLMRGDSKSWGRQLQIVRYIHLTPPLHRHNLQLGVTNIIKTLSSPSSQFPSQCRNSDNHEVNC